jgi:hypothetical protein
MAAATAEAVDFEKEILPFFEAKCIECHRAPYEEDGRTKKPKAGLRMDAAWAINIGSESGAVLVPDKPDDSELYYRVTLPDDDDDFMPPTGKADPLTLVEIALFKKWIEEGADFGDWTGNLEGKPEEVSDSGGKVPVSEIQELYKRLAEGVDAPNSESWEPITTAGGRVAPLSKSSPLLAVDFRLTTENANDEAIGSIGVIAPNIVHLDLSKTAVTDGALSILNETPKLVRLNLSQTAITDAGLRNLSSLKELRYLNLYGSGITDAGLKNLEGLKSLEAVYLWQSKATEAGAKKLSSALPNAKINFK